MPELPKNALDRLVNALQQMIWLHEDDYAGEPTPAEIFRELHSSSFIAGHTCPEVVTREIRLAILELKTSLHYRVDKNFQEARSLVRDLRFHAERMDPGNCNPTVPESCQHLIRLRDAIQDQMLSGTFRAQFPGDSVEIALREANRERQDFMTKELYREITDLPELIRRDRAKGIPRAYELVNMLFIEASSPRPVDADQAGVSANKGTLSKWRELEDSTPELSREESGRIGDWANQSVETFKTFGRDREQLKELRKERGGGAATPCKTLGIDGANQVWRKETKTSRSVFYLRSAIAKPIDLNRG